jgi:hypothetical protein
VDQNLSLLSAAGNVEVPAYLVLRQKGYLVGAYGRSADHGGWYAEKDGSRFQGDSLIEVLGLVCMYEARGANWAAADQDIDDFLRKYDT